MNSAEYSVLMGLATALIITAIANNLINGLITGFVLNLIIMLIIKGSLDIKISSAGISMILSFIFIGTAYGQTLSEVFGLTTILLPLGYMLTGVIASIIAYYIRGAIYGN